MRNKKKVCTFKSFIKTSEASELILAVHRTKTQHSTIKKKSQVREKGRETQKERKMRRVDGFVTEVGGPDYWPDRYIFIFLCRRYHLKGFLITTTRQKLLGFLPDPLNDKISLHSLSFLISAKHLGASSSKYRRMNVKMPFGDAGVTFDKKLLD